MMIRRSLILTAVLLILFEAFIRLSDIKWDTSQNDKAINLISAQNFIYNLPDNEVGMDTLIIGSSISRKLLPDSLGEHYVNLAFNGWSSYDGLELVRLTRKKPACIMVETNIVGNQILQQDMVSSLRPLSYYTNTTFKSFQLRNQPIGLMVGYFKNLMKNKIEEQKKKKRENLALYKFNLQLEKKKLWQTIPDSVLDAKFTVLKSMINHFRRENINVIFFEAPIDEELENTATVVKLRKYFHLYFPVGQYTYLPGPKINNFSYSDGFHLTAESAVVYTLYLKQQLNDLNNVN
ncbi:MAG TPA: hypothetical protein VK622_12600 [Puia sp.]|nr:hypothetical protein [Puia sp.]